MGEKGAKESQDAATIVEQLLRDLAPIGDVSCRKMFGGYGIFEGSTMFALVNSQGELFLKADDSNRPRFEQIGAKQHGKMPYFQPSPEVFADEDSLRDWAQVSIEVARANKKR
jgi:DNA transformation protein